MARLNVWYNKNKTKKKTLFFTTRGPPWLYMRAVYLWLGEVYQGILMCFIKGAFSSKGQLYTHTDDIGGKRPQCHLQNYKRTKWIFGAGVQLMSRICLLGGPSHIRERESYWFWPSQRASQVAARLISLN